MKNITLAATLIGVLAALPCSVHPLSANAATISYCGVYFQPPAGGVPGRQPRMSNGSELQPIPATCFSGGEINQNPQPLSTDFALTLTLPTGSATG